MFYVTVGSLFLFSNSCQYHHTDVSCSARGGRITKFENSEWKVFVHIHKLLSKKSFYLVKYFSNNFDISVLFGMALWKQYIESHVANTNVLPLI